MNLCELSLYRRPILLKGYHPDHNPARNYKLAKQPLPTSRGWTNPDYQPPDTSLIETWISSEGWVGHLVPEGVHVIDVEDQAKIDLIRNLCKQKGITPPVNITNNGVQFVFSTNGGPPIPGATGRITRMGFPVTDRSANKNYLILPPTNGRTWENDAMLDNPPIIPDELLQTQDNAADTMRALAWALGEEHRKGLLAGYDDLDGSFMALLLSCDTPEDKIIEAFQLAFLEDFDEKRTLAMLQRTKERFKNGDPLLGIGSLVQSLKERNLNSIVALVTKLQRLAGKVPQTKDEGGGGEGEGGEEEKKRKSKTDKLIKMALAAFELFHDKDIKAYATIQRDQHRETFPLRSKAFRTCLSGIFWNQYGEGIGGQIVQDALGTLEGHAIHGGPCHAVHVRLAEHNGRMYIDLGSDRFDVVEIGPDGWRVLNNQNIVKFRRPSGISSLPYPKAGGSINALKRYINLANPEDWPLIVGFIIGCFHPSGPYPILAITGEQGSAKSTLLKVIKAITDPSTAPLRSTPKSLRDLAISANNTWNLAFDNLSDIPGWLSDAFCRLATGGGFATRTLYSDDDETIFDAKRSVMLNGIDNVIKKHDLADRGIILNLAVISEERRIDEKEFWDNFEDDSPEILGAILDAVSCALRSIDTIHLASHPRMADFAKWVTGAALQLGWEEETFLKAYRKNIREITSLTLDADLVGTAVRIFMEGQTQWEGTATELLNALEHAADERTKKNKRWPGAAHVLSGKLKRSATALRTHGIEVVFLSRSSDKKLIRLWSKGGKRASQASSRGLIQYIIMK